MGLLSLGEGRQREVSVLFPIPYWGGAEMSLQDTH